MPTIMDVSGEIEVPADVAWSVVSDFGQLDRWNPAILEIDAEETREGTVRHFRTSAGLITERLVEIDADRRTLRYTIVSGSRVPLFTISVKPRGESRCVVRWSLEGDLIESAPHGTAQELSQRYVGRIDDLRAAIRAL